MVAPATMFVGCVVNANVETAPAPHVSVNVSGEPDKPVDVAVTVTCPTVSEHVRPVVASPSAPVVTCVVESVPLLVEKLTTTPAAGPASEAVTFATIDCGSA